MSLVVYLSTSGPYCRATVLLDCSLALESPFPSVPLLDGTLGYAYGHPLVCCGLPLAGAGVAIYAPHLRIRCMTLVIYLLSLGSYCRYITRYLSCHPFQSRLPLSPNSLLALPHSPPLKYFSRYPTRNIPCHPSCYLPRYLHATISPPPTSLPTSLFSPPSMSPSITSLFTPPLTLSPFMTPPRHL
jgi:hypothetical protein